MKIIYGFIHEELAEFSGWATASRASGEPPQAVGSFYWQMSSGNYLLRPDDLTALVQTYNAYAPHLPADEKVLVLGGILSACARSELTDVVSDELSFFVSTAVKVLSDGGWGQIDTAQNFLEPICKAMRKVVTAHLPLLSTPALQAYFSSSRRFTKYTHSEEGNAFSLHPSSWVFEVVMTNKDNHSLPNQAMMAVIHHFFSDKERMIEDKDCVFDEGTSTGRSPAVQKLIEFGGCLTRLSRDGLYLPPKYPDLLVVSLLVERFALAASAPASTDDREPLLQGVSSLVDLVLRNRPEKVISKDLNMFVTDGPGFVFYYPPAARLLEKELLKSTSSQRAMTGVAAEAIQDFHWAVVRNDLYVHAKHRSEGYDNHQLIAGLAPHCRDRLQVPGALDDFRPELQAMVVSSIQDADLKKRLLKQYRDCRGQVLTDDLGM